MSNKIAIVGSGHTKFGRLDTQTLEDLIVAAATAAIQDAHLSADQIDAVFLGHFNSGLVPDGFASSLIHQVAPELRFKPAVRCENACASGSAALYAGIAAIQSGQAQVVLVVGAEKMTSNSTQEVTQALAGAGYQNSAEEAKLSFPQVFAIAANAYTQRYQSPMGPMAAIASKNHTNALSNPLAHMQRAMSFDMCNQVTDKNPLIAPPLRLSDCSLITDGAVAVILVSDLLREGSLPVNLSGGLKAKGHPVGATGVSMHAIAYRQLTGQAGEMQINNPQLGLVFNMGGTGVANYATVLEARSS